MAAALMNVCSVLMILVASTRWHAWPPCIPLAGVVTPPLLRLLDNALREAAELPEGCERRPQIVAYSHYPLSVIQHMGQHHLGHTGAASALVPLTTCPYDEQQKTAEAALLALAMPDLCSCSSFMFHAFDLGSRRSRSNHDGSS